MLQAVEVETQPGQQGLVDLHVERVIGRVNGRLSPTPAVAPTAPSRACPV